MKQRTIRPGQIVLLLAIALVHVSAWFGYYGSLPPGQEPTEAARDILNTAETIAGANEAGPLIDGEVPLYTQVVSVFARFADTEAGIMAAARAFNVFSLLWITAACAVAASRYWQSRRAVWITGLLIGLNPVLVFWSAELSPALPATACLATAVAFFLPWFRSTEPASSLIIGLALSIAAILQTAMLPFALLWPAFAFLYPVTRKCSHLLASALPPLIIFGWLLLTDISLQTPWPWAPGSLADEAAQAYLALTNLEPSEVKSFGLYRELHLLLFLNPIHWGAIFLLAAGGIYARLKEHSWSPTILVCLGVFGLFTLSFAWNDGGSQTRLGLLPLTAVLAGGAYMLPQIWHRANSRRQLKLLAAGSILAALIYIPNFVSDPAKTWENDYVYLAEANLARHQNKRATTWAEKALEINPKRLDMQKVLVLAQFNTWALGSQPRTLPVETAREYLAATLPVQSTDTLRTIRGIYMYKLRDSEAATAIWEAEKTTSPLAMLCLYWTGALPGAELPEASEFLNERYAPLLREALIADRNDPVYTDFEKKIDNLLALAY